MLFNVSPPVHAAGMKVWGLRVYCRPGPKAASSQVATQSGQLESVCRISWSLQLRDGDIEII